MPPPKQFPIHRTVRITREMDWPLTAYAERKDIDVAEAIREAIWLLLAREQRRQAREAGR